MKNVVSVIASLNFYGVALEANVLGIINEKRLGKNWKFRYLMFNKKLEKL